MEPNVQRDDEIEIDLKELFFYLLEKAVYIVGAGMALAALALAVTVFLITPKYTSTTSMYVLNRQTSESVTNSDLQSSTYLTKDYIELIKSRTVVENVIADLELDQTYENVLSSMEVSAKSDTRIISISVTDEDPYEARAIANAVRVAASAQIQQVMKTEAVNVVDEANIPTEKSSPNAKKNVLIAGVLGVFLTAAWFLVLFLMNDKIVTADDVERYLGLGILGQMPLDEAEVKQKKKRKAEKKAQSKHAKKTV